MNRRLTTALACASLLFALQAPARAQEEPIRIGGSVGLSGYLAFIDLPWRDGAQLAIEAENEAGGVLGKTLELVIEDMRSEPAEAVSVVRKLIDANKVVALVNGCSSAGNSAAAAIVGRAEIPMMLCSILPSREADQKWAFSYQPPATFDVDARLSYLQKRGITKVGVLYDATPYSGFQKKVAEEKVADHGIEIVGFEQFKPNDADMTAYLTKLNAAGAQAILKMGSGPATVTISKGLRQLDLKLPLLASTEDLTVVAAASEVIGAQFIFPALSVQMPDQDGNQAGAEFLSRWKAKYGDRDPSWGSRGWDAIKIVSAAIRKADSTEGADILAAIQSLGEVDGASGTLGFTADNHVGVQKDPYRLVSVDAGKFQVLQ